MNMDFQKWVLAAIIIAVPVAWLSMDRWLENYAYRIQLSWWIFVVSGITAVIIALMTISWQSWRAATRNPVEALRYE
jgi:putative ABC transport system permease protein